MYNLPLQSKHRKNRLTKLTILIALAAVAIGGYAFGPRAWHWAERKYLLGKQARALTQAKSFFESRDPAAAAAALRVALEAQPGNAAAWRTAADLLEQAGAREAVQLRRRTVELEPEVAANRLALAQTALRFGEFDTAMETFATLPDTTKAAPDAERLALALSLQGQAAPIADALFADLEKKTPADARLAFSHQVLLLRHPRPEKAAQAREAVERFAGQSEYRLPALRELYLDAVSRKEPDRALRFAHELAAAPGAALGDKLSAANADLIFGKKPLETIKPALAAQAAGSAADAVQFAQWLLVQQRTDEAKAWIASLPAAVAGSPAIAAWKADLALREGNWEELGALLRGGAWGPVSPAALQLALAAHLVGDNEAATLRLQLWREAVKQARGDLNSLRVLHQLAASWAWPNEAIESLAAIAAQFPSQAWAHEARVTLCRRLKDTRGMLAGLEQWRKADPRSERLRYNSSLIAVLLTEGVLPADAPGKLDIENLHKRNPLNPSYTTSVAFALAKAGQKDEAVAMADTLPMEVRALPQRAPYLAYVYMVGERYDVVNALVAKAEGTDFLPEEERLLTLAKTTAERALDYRSKL